MTKVNKNKISGYHGPVAAHQAGTSSIFYGSDRNADKGWRYTFNSLGYRGEEVDSNADHRILVTGDSNTVGEGVSWEETWGYQLCQLLTKNNEKIRGKVSLLNVAQSGAPNDYITRAAMAEAEWFKPTLVIALFSHITRKESIQNSRIEHIGPWREDELSEDFYLFYSEEDGLINTLKNILLLKSFCAVNNFPFIWSSIDSKTIFNSATAKHPVCQQYLSLIGTVDFVPCNLFGGDLGVDNIHPGGKSHKGFAEVFCSRSLEIYAAGQ